MNRAILIFFLWLICLTSCSAQDVYPIEEIENSKELRNIFWKLEPGSIMRLHTPGEYFFKTFIIPLSEGESNLEGDILHRIYLLKGEYGEYPDGILYRIGDFYAPTIKKLSLENVKVIVEIEYIEISNSGGTAHQITKIYQIEN